MNSYVIDFKHVDKTKLMFVGGKGANLGELYSIEGINVPDGFCISTEAFKIIIEDTPSIKELIQQLSQLTVEHQDKIAQLSSEIRRIIEEAVIPKDIIEEIIDHLLVGGENHSYAVRSSATAEDLPTASFAGQQDTYLNIIGKDEILKCISKCWASLFTDRAVTYRIKNGFDHSKVYLAVIVQSMVFSQASGIMFTADPVTSNRKVISIDAGYGLGEALVSGIVNADIYKVRHGSIVHKNISTKKLAVRALNHGGTKIQHIEADMQQKQVLTDKQILQLENIGRKIEEHFGCPQDIEWCLADDKFYIVQSRSITTLFPVPEANDNEKHVYISVGHQQMMTDALKPLGLSIFQLTSFGPRYKAAGRLFVDVAQTLSSSAGSKALLNTMAQHDPLMKDALVTLIQRKDFIKVSADDENKQNAGNGSKAVQTVDFQQQLENIPAMVSDLIKNSEKAIEQLKENIKTKSGVDLMNFISADIQQLKMSLTGQNTFAFIMGGLNASTWLNEHMEKWLGEKNAADVLSQSVPNNITSEMGLKLLDVADVIRPYGEIVEYLHHVKEDDFLEELTKFKGGTEVFQAINDYISKYGMRCAGEIDITKTRWGENPVMLVPLILGNIKNFKKNAGKEKFQQGFQQALKKEQQLLHALKQLPDGEEKAKETKIKITILRDLIGYREYPKYEIVSRYFIYRQALLKEAEKLVKHNIINEKEDIYYLTFDELAEVIRTNKVHYNIITKAKQQHILYEKLTPPRVITSEGEIIAGQYKREKLPAHALVGLAVSSGVVEGRARVILNMEQADLETGDILVTAFTDPSWTPLFVSIKALVTEVGGLMTHGAVIAREYGLPAVIGVENATKIIKDGQRIRVNGTEGYVEILE